MIALDLYVGENALANHLSSPKGSACTRCVQMSLHLLPDVNVPAPDHCPIPARSRRRPLPRAKNDPFISASRS